MSFTHKKSLMDNIKDTNPQKPLPNNTEPLSFFDADKKFIFVYKKTEKLATAIYMVTNLFSQSEPMKWALREKVGSLLSFMIVYKDTPVPEQNNFVYDAKNRVLDIVSLLEVSYRSGLVSQMNFSILKQEFSELLHQLDMIALQATEQPHVEDIAQYRAIKEGAGDTRARLPITFFDSPHFTTASSFHPASNASLTYQNFLGREKKEPSPLIERSPGDQDVLKRSNRQNLIIQLLKKKKEVTVKDIGEVIKGCSEKTIQRELTMLIAMHVLKKTGARRWTKYSLNINQ